MDITRDGQCRHRALIANGWGRLHYNGNDESGSGRQDVWSFKGDGLLTTPSGQQLHFSGHLARSYHKNLTAGRCNSTVNLH